MEKLTILLLVAAVLLSTQVLVQGDGEKSQKRMDLLKGRMLSGNLNKRCDTWRDPCTYEHECCWQYHCGFRTCE
uniref:Conotoxin Di6.10 n=1 Tax=Conus distans TaxID=72281 RepID=M9PNG1_CONDI|nr:conotoxin Di6.10 [Conus distans]